MKRIVPAEATRSRGTGHGSSQMYPHERTPHQAHCIIHRAARHCRLSPRRYPSQVRSGQARAPFATGENALVVRFNLLDPGPAGCHLNVEQPEDVHAMKHIQYEPPARRCGCEGRSRVSSRAQPDFHRHRGGSKRCCRTEVSFIRAPELGACVVARIESPAISGEAREVARCQSCEAASSYSSVRPAG